MTTTIQRWGNSHAIRIPKNILNLVNWNEGEELFFKVDDGKIVIEKSKRRKSIEELFEGFDGDYTPEEIEWGEPVGDEVW